MTWIDDAVRATTRGELEAAWQRARREGDWNAERDASWCAALVRRFDDVDAVAMNELIKQLGVESIEVKR